MARKKRAAKAPPPPVEDTPAPPPPVVRSLTRLDLGAAGLLVVLTFIAYWPAIHGGIIMDDERHLTQIPLRSLHGLWRIWFDLGATSQYYPLLHSAFWTEYHLWGNAVTGYHVVNILLHAGSALLLVAILRRLNIPGAWFGGFVFALHPLCVESVAWISEQKNTLSTFFYLAAALSYIRFDQTRAAKAWRWALGLFFLALLSKSVTATLPAALLVFFWWQRGRIDTERDLKPIAPMLAAGVAMGLFTAWVERTYIGATGPDFDLSPGSRLLVAGRVVWFYLGKIVWPSGYMFVYPRWDVTAPSGSDYAIPLAVVVAATALALLAKKNRAPLAVLAIFLITQIPVLGFLNVYPFLYSFVWDHFLYLASPVVIVAVTAGITILARRFNVRGDAVAAVIVAGLSALTFVHAGTFRDGITLYSDTLQRNPAAWLAHNNLGAQLLLKPNGVPEAITHFEAALKMRPQQPDAHFNLGSALSSVPGKQADAIREYQAALTLKEDLPEAHNNLGRDLTTISGREREGIAHIERALAFNPDFADAHKNLGLALAKIPGRAGDALDHMEKALQLDPDLPGGRDSLELVLANTPGRAHESISYFEAKVKANPESADMQNALGNALRNQPDRMLDAITHFREALRIKPGLVEARMNLANTLAQLPDRQPEAIGEYQAVLKFSPHFPEAHNNLGNALVSMGRKTEAAEEFIAAMHDSPASADPHVNLGALFFEQGRVADAVGQFEQATRLDPTLAEAHSDLAFALLKLPGRTADALAEFETALRLKPDPELQERVGQLRKVMQAGAAP